MMATAHVRANALWRGVEIIIAPTYTTLLRWTQPTKETVETGAAAAPEHILDLPNDIAFALYEALHEHFGKDKTPSGDAVNEALLVERARVDRLLGALLSYHETSTTIPVLPTWTPRGGSRD